MEEHDRWGSTRAAFDGAVSHSRTNDTGTLAQSSSDAQAARTII